jgi:hypothetical protein
MSIIYFLIILALSWVFYTVMTNSDAMGLREIPMKSTDNRTRFGFLVPTIYIISCSCRSIGSST